MKTIVPPAKRPGWIRGQRDLPEALEAGAAEVLRGLLHRRVDVGQRGHRVQVENRVEGQGLDHGDAPELVRREPVERPAPRTQVQVDDQSGEGAVLPEDLLDADGPHEGRQDHGHEDQRTEHALGGKDKAVGDEGQGQGDQERHDRSGHRQHERIPQSHHVGAVGEEGPEVGEGDMPVRVDKATLQDLEDRPEKEHREEHRGEPENNARSRLRHCGAVCPVRQKGRKAEIRRFLRALAPGVKRAAKSPVRRVGRGLEWNPRRLELSRRRPGSHAGHPAPLKAPVGKGRWGPSPPPERTSQQPRSQHWRQAGVSCRRSLYSPGLLREIVKRTNERPWPFRTGGR